MGLGCVTTRYTLTRTKNQGGSSQAKYVEWLIGHHTPKEWMGGRGRYACSSTCSTPTTHHHQPKYLNSQIGHVLAFPFLCPSSNTPGLVLCTVCVRVRVRANLMGRCRRVSRRACPPASPPPGRGHGKEVGSGRICCV